MAEEPDVVFSTAVEGLYQRGLKGRVTPELRGRLRGVGIDLDQALLPAYPLPVWAEALRTTSRALFPDKAVDDGIAELGRMTVQGLRETLIGPAIFPLLRLLGPRRVLQRMTRNLRNGSNFIETKLLLEEAQQAEIWFNRVREVGFYRGVLEAGLKAAGASEATAEICTREGDAVVYRVRWS